MSEKKKKKMTPSTLVLFCLGFVAGSDISLTVDPSSVQPPDTKSMSLRCSYPALDVQTTPSVDLVGRSAPMRRSPPERLTHVTGITLSKDDVIIARVDAYNPAAMATGVNLGHVNVTGEVKGNNQEFGYLQLNWTSPGQDVGGLYRCEVRGVTGTRHLATLNTSLDVQTQAGCGCGSQDHLIQRLQDQDEKIINMQNASKLLTDKIAAIEKSLEQTKQESSMRESQLQTQLEVTNKRLEDAGHNENGRIDCFYNNWSSPDRTITRTFSKTYSKPPIVHLGVVQNKFHDDHFENSWYKVEVVGVTETGFRVHCYAQNSRQFALSVDWLSVSSE